MNNESSLLPLSLPLSTPHQCTTSAVDLFTIQNSLLANLAKQRENNSVNVHTLGHKESLGGEGGGGLVANILMQFTQANSNLTSRGATTKCADSKEVLLFSEASTGKLGQLLLWNHLAAMFTC